MNDAPRRFLMLLIAFGLAATALFALRSGSDRHGLFASLRSLNVFRTKTNPGHDVQHRPEAATLASGNSLTSDDVPGLFRLSQELAAVSERVMPSVVSIAAAPQEKDSSEGASRPRLGAGFIVSTEGHVITAYHVVHRVSAIIVRRKWIDSNVGEIPLGLTDSVNDPTAPGTGPFFNECIDPPTAGAPLRNAVIQAFFIRSR